MTSTSRSAPGGRRSLPRHLVLLALAMTLATATLVIDRGTAEAAPAGRPLGVDVSVYQHPNGQAIDWNAVRRYGVRFALVKATEGPQSSGGYYTNSWFKRDWNGAINAGIATGAYHYARPRLPVWTAALDARQFVATVGSNIGRGGMPPVLDLEESGGLGQANLTAWTRTFLTELQRLTGRQPMIYTALWYWNSFLGGSTQFSQYPLWIANYAQTPGLMPGGWSGWNFWQYTGHGSVPGIAGEVDINVACGSGASLAGWCPGTQYSTWATQYYNKLWQERAKASAAANASGVGTKQVTPTTKATSASTSGAGTASSGTAKSSTKQGSTTPTTSAKKTTATTKQTTPTTKATTKTR